MTAMFLERLQNYGIDKSPYYIYKNDGGKFNPVPSSKSDTAMPNCTDYALCRGWEASEAPKPFPIALPTSTGFGNAKTWYDKTPLPKGKELKVGSIAVFDGTYGHVAFVERVIDKTHALISQSQYDANKSLRNYKYFETREVELVVGKATLSGIGSLIGFIYLPINDIRVNRNSDKEQVEIIQQMVNVRTSPEGYVYREGCYAPMGIYNVQDKKEVNGYMWYQLEKDHWVREGDWLKYYELSDLANLKKENEEMKKAFKEVNLIISKYL